MKLSAPPGRGRGPESMRGLAGMLRATFPDLRFEIEELVAEGDVVAGPHAPRALRGGEAVKHRGVRDDLGMMRQLGVVPGTGQAGEPGTP